MYRKRDGALVAWCVAAMWATHWGWLACAGHAGPISPATAGELDRIEEAQKANRAKCKDLLVTGKASTRHTQDFRLRHDQITFKYYELGGKRRIDESHSTASSFVDTAGKTYRMAFDGSRTLSYMVGSDAAEIGIAGLFKSRASIAFLENLVAGDAWEGHLGHVRFLRDRGWDSQAETMQVERDEKGGVAQQRITYESRRGEGTTRYEWVVDESRGCEVVSARATSAYPDGKPLSETEASYEVREVSAGVFRVVAGRSRQTRYDTKGKAVVTEQSVEADTATANAGEVEAALLTLAGMEVPDDTLVTDSTIRPARQYRHSAPTPRSQDGDRGYASVSVSPGATASGLDSSSSSPGWEDALDRWFWPLVCAVVIIILVAIVLLMRSSTEKPNKHARRPYSG